MLSCTLSPAVKKIPHPSRKFRVLVKQKFQISWSFAALSLPSTSVSKADVKNHLWFTGHETISNTDMKSFPLSPVNKHQKQKISPVNDQRRSTHLLQSAWCLVRIPQWFRLYTWPYKNLPTLAVGGELKHRAESNFHCQPLVHLVTLLLFRNTAGPEDWLIPVLNWILT